VLAQNTDSPAVVQTAERKGVHAFGWDSDMSKYGPRAQLTANTQNWAVYYIDEVQKTLDGKWTGGRSTAWGIEENMVVLTPLNKSVPADVAKLFEERKQAIATRKLNIFAGPLQDNKGVQKVAAGAALPQKDVMSINWYVEGVEGSVPK
jgi:basic membrane protein A and related proteins